MKILMIFIDMLGGAYMNLCNPNFETTDMDRLVKTVGGTVYSKCYTPAPDTPRSSACMWTGLYPKINGCNIRVKWPRYFMNDEVDSIWKVFKRNNYTINIYINKSTEHVGLIPNIGGINIFNDSIYNFFSNAVLRDDSLNFVYLNDLHRILDNTNYSIEGYTKGNAFCANIVRKFLCEYTMDFFDIVMIYSDHGFRLSGVTRRHLLENDRAQTFMYMRKKGDCSLNVDKRLRSNLDVFPTLCNICGFDINNDIHGISLDDPNGHNCVFIEDHDKFTSELGQTIEHWACMDKDTGWHWLEPSGEWEHEFMSETFDADGARDDIVAKMSFYEDNSKVYYVLNSLEKLKTANLENNYSDGTRAEIYKPFYALKGIGKFEKKNVIIYGAGKCGEDICAQIRSNGKINLVGVVDLNWHIKSTETVAGKVEGPAALLDRKYDYIIIAIFDNNIAAHAIDILTQIGISSEKIVWEQPVIKMMEENIE